LSWCFHPGGPGVPTMMPHATATMQKPSKKEEKNNNQPVCMHLGCPMPPLPSSWCLDHTSWCSWCHNMLPQSPSRQNSKLCREKQKEEKQKSTCKACTIQFVAEQQKQKTINLSNKNKKTNISKEKRKDKKMSKIILCSAAGELCNSPMHGQCCCNKACNTALVHHVIWHAIDTACNKPCDRPRALQHAIGCKATW